MIVFEELVDFRDSWMIYFLELVNLLFEKFSLMTPYLVFVDNVDSPNKCSLFMYRFSQFVELVLLEAGRQQFVLLFNATFDFLDEINLFELDLVLLMQDLDRAFLGLGTSHAVSHRICISPITIIRSFERLNPYLFKNEIQFPFRNMKHSASTVLLLTMVMLAVSNVNAACSVCSQCPSCGPDVMSDKYLDDIDALLQNKIEQLGFPFSVGRNESDKSITYDIQYSNGLQITLSLMLDTMQIQLINYIMKASPQVQTTTAVTNYKTTSDGYFIIENYGNNSDVSSIVTFLSGVVKTNFSTFQLVGAQFTNTPALLYRLHYKILPFSTSKSIIEDILVQSLGQNSYRLIDSNFSVYSSNVSLTSADPRLILSDSYISGINTIIVNKYRNLVGNNPSLVSLAKSQPYYQFVYQAADTNYSFYILYDYFQARILQGNITAIKTVITTEATQNKIQSQQSTTGGIQSVGGAANGAFTSVLSTAVPSAISTNGVTTTSTSAPTVSSSSTSTTTTTSSSTSQSSSSSSGSASQTVTPQIVVTQNTVQTSQPQVTAVTTETATQGFQEIARFSTSTEVMAALSYLSSLNQSLSMSQIQSVQKMNNGSFIFYKISVKLLTVGQFEFKDKTIFYQYFLSFSPITSTFSIVNATYVNLDSPVFDQQLAFDDIKADNNIREIARYLLTQQFPMLGPGSRVLAVFRDIPYYKLVFEASGNNQITFIILFNINGNSVQVLSATTQQKRVSDSITTTTTTSTTSAPTTVSSSTPTVVPSTSSQSVSNQNVVVSETTKVIENKQTATGSTKTTTEQSTSSQNIPGQKVQANLTTSQSPSLIKVTPLTQVEPLPQTPSLPVQPSTSTTTSSSVTVNNQQVNNGNVQITPTITVSVSQQQNQPTEVNLVKINPVVTPAVVQTQTVTTSQKTAITGSNSTSSQTAQSVEPVLVHIPLITTPNTASSQISNNQSSSSQTNVQISSSSSSIGSSDVKPQNLPAQQINLVQVPLAPTSNQNSVQSAVQTTQTTSQIQTTTAQTGSSNQNVVVQTPISTTTTTSTTASSNPTTVETSINGFTHFSNTNDPLYQFVLQAMEKINAAFIEKGNKQSQIVYRDIIYKLDGTTLTILIKVEVNAFMYSYQYKGTVGSSIILSATTALPSTTTTSTTTTSDTSNILDTAASITINNTIYQRISETILNQSYIQQYLNYLETTDICYQRKNLIGVFTNPQVTNSFFFRYRNNTQYYNIFTSSADIQKTLTNYLKTKDQSTQSTQIQQTIVQSTSQTTPQSTQSAQPVQPVQSTQPIQQAVQTTQQSSEGSSSTTSSQVTQQKQQQTIVQQAVTIPQSTQPSQAGSQVNSAQSSVISQVSQTSSIVRKPASEIDPNCLCYDRERCLKCSHRFYLNNNQCIQIPSECQSYDQSTGTCLKCMPGFFLNSGLCQLEDVAAYFIDGQCVSCFGSYRLVNKKCVYVPVTNVSSPEYMQAKNPLCFSWNGQKCVDCLPGTFLSSRNICQLVDPFCSVFDYALQTCSNCENGYAPRNGKCFKIQ